MQTCAVARGIAVTLLVAALVSACSDGGSGQGGDGATATAREWRMFGGTLERRSFNAAERKVDKGNVSRLIPAGAS